MPPSPPVVPFPPVVPVVMVVPGVIISEQCRRRVHRGPPTAERTGDEGHVEGTRPVAGVDKDGVRRVLQRQWHVPRLTDP